VAGSWHGPEFAAYHENEQEFPGVAQELTEQVLEQFLVPEHVCVWPHALAEEVTEQEVP
jgi:hypothetical protein